MAQYVLECPACLARINLRRYIPRRRIRCPKCRAVVEIPVLEGAGPGDAPGGPRLRERFGEILRLKRLAAVALLLVLALAAGFTILVRQREGRATAAEGAPEDLVTVATLPTVNRTLAIPLARGHSWEYSIKGGGTEERTVLRMVPGTDDAPEFEVVTRGTREAARQTLRAMKDGVYLVSEARGDARVSFEPPLRLVPRPLHTDDPPWTYEGDCVREGGAAERWRLEFTVKGAEAVNTGMGRQTATRIDICGKQGTTAVEESLWYVKGLGVVRRVTRLDDRVEEATLIKFVRR